MIVKANKTFTLPDKDLPLCKFPSMSEPGGNGHLAREWIEGLQWPYRGIQFLILIPLLKFLYMNGVVIISSSFMCVMNWTPMPLHAANTRRLEESYRVHLHFWVVETTKEQPYFTALELEGVEWSCWQCWQCMVRWVRVVYDKFIHNIPVHWCSLLMGNWIKVGN